MKKAFTLAEVLITLTVVGVIAAITVPGLMQNTEEMEYKTAIKKTVATLNSALKQSQALNGIDASSASSSSALKDLFAAHLNIAQTGNGTTTGSALIVYLVDGTKIYFSGSYCSDNLTPQTFNLATPGLKCYAIVDVNGQKKPDRVAQSTKHGDIYILGIGATKVIPLKLSSGFAPTSAACTSFCTSYWDVWIPAGTDGSLDALIN